MKHTITLLCIIFSISVFAQSDIEKAEELINEENYAEAYSILKNLKKIYDPKDLENVNIVWLSVLAINKLESSARNMEDFEESLKFGLESLELITEGMPYFEENYTKRKYWMHKNVIVSYFGLGQLEKAKEHKDILYKAYDDKVLPDALDENFNFSFFKWKDKNIWGYEWYPELGDPETKGSFTKIVYYIYSTNPDGSDKNQLFRLHVLKFHKLDESLDIDYVLTAKVSGKDGDTSKTLYNYTYKKDIDYNKLQGDIIEILEGYFEH